MSLNRHRSTFMGNASLSFARSGGPNVGAKRILGMEFGASTSTRACDQIEALGQCGSILSERLPQQSLPTVTKDGVSDLPRNRHAKPREGQSVPTTAHHQPLIRCKGRAVEDAVEVRLTSDSLRTSESLIAHGGFRRWHVLYSFSDSGSSRTRGGRARIGHDRAIGPIIRIGSRADRLRFSRATSNRRI